MGTGLSWACRKSGNWICASSTRFRGSHACRACPASSSSSTGVPPSPRTPEVEPRSPGSLPRTAQFYYVKKKAPSPTGSANTVLAGAAAAAQAAAQAAAPTVVLRSTSASLSRGPSLTGETSALKKRIQVRLPDGICSRACPSPRPSHPHSHPACPTCLFTVRSQLRSSRSAHPESNSWRARCETCARPSRRSQACS